MDGFTKLHAKIVHSSIWNEKHHVRLLWITMLAVADADGNIEGSVGGLAHLARITVPEAREALEILMGPEDDSTDGTDGQRVRELTSGVYHIINHGHYRQRQTRRQALNAEASKRYRGKNKGGGDASATSSDITEGCVHTQTQTQTETTEAHPTPEMDGRMDDGLPGSVKRTSQPTAPSTRTGPESVGAVVDRFMEDIR